MCFSWQINGLGARFICLFYENETQVVLTAKNGQKQQRNLPKAAVYNHCTENEEKMSQ